MSDCANVEMRELLPELARGALDAGTRARVETHVAGCAECAAELETLRLVRAAFGSAPAIDARRIVAALPSGVDAPTPVRERGLGRRWMDWRIAAALTMMTVGGLSVVVTQRMPRTEPVPPVTEESTLVASTPLPPLADTASHAASRSRASAPPVATRQEKPQLSIGGGVDDLDRASFDALMGALDEIDRAPIAPSVEPERVTVLPMLDDDTR